MSSHFVDVFGLGKYRSFANQECVGGQEDNNRIVSYQDFDISEQFYLKFKT